MTSTFENCKLDIKILDDCHELILNLMENIYDLNNPEIRDRELKLFLEELRAHFKREEAFMLSIDYPGLDEHKKTHCLLLEKVCELGVRNMLNLLTDKYYKENLKKVVIHHIAGDDTKLAEYYEELKNKSK